MTATDRKEAFNRFDPLLLERDVRFTYCCDVLNETDVIVCDTDLLSK